MHAHARELEDPSEAFSFLITMADYAAAFAIGDSALGAARHCLIEALARGFETLRDPESAARVAPVVPGAVMPGGARVPGTSLELDPVQAAFCISLMLFSRTADDDPWLAPRGACAAESLGAILAVADYQARKATMEGKPPPKVREVLVALLKAVEIQSAIIALDGDSHSALGTDTRFACAAGAAITTAQLGGTRAQIVRAVSWASNDGAIYINSDSDSRQPCGRAEWAWADSVGRAVRHACQAMSPGRASFLTAEDLDMADAAGGVLRVKYITPKKPLGTVFIDPLAGRPKARESAQITARFRAAVDRHFPIRQAERLKSLFAAPERLDDLPVNELMAALVTNGAR